MVRKKSRRGERKEPTSSRSGPLTHTNAYTRTYPSYASIIDRERGGMDDPQSGGERHWIEGGGFQSLALALHRRRTGMVVPDPP
jgi:hypothetical protein